MISKHDFLEHFEIFLEGCCQLSNCFLVGDKNIDLLETSAIGNKYITSLKTNGFYQVEEEPTRVTPTSESHLDHIVHNGSTKESFCQLTLDYASIPLVRC